MDVYSKEKRSDIMSRIKSENTGPEVRLQCLLSINEIPYETHAKDLPGTPDLYIREANIAVFVDGDFWHGKSYPPMKPMDAYWSAKIESNMKRDIIVNKKLKHMGVKVMRIWEADIKKRPAECVMKIHRAYVRAKIYKGKERHESEEAVYRLQG